MIKRLLFLVLLSVICGCSSEQDPKELVVFSAVSLQQVMEELRQGFEKENNCSIHFNFGSSGALAQQIIHGAEPSLFLSANPKWMDYLEANNESVEAKIIAKNRLVLIAPTTNSTIPFELRDLPNYLGHSNIAIGDPRMAPVGQYAEQVINHLKWSEILKDKMHFAKDAKETLRLVELGEVSFGLVYYTDAILSEKIRIMNRVSDSLHDPIIYQSCLLNEMHLGKTFEQYLLSSEAQTVWEKHGFSFKN